MSDEPIFSILSGKFINGFTVSGFTGQYAVLNGNYTLQFYNSNRGTCTPECWNDWDNCGEDEQGYCNQAETDAFGRSSPEASFYYSTGDWQFFDFEFGLSVVHPTPNQAPGYENFPTTGWTMPNGDVLTFTPL